MPEVALGIDPVPYTLLEHFGLRKAAVFFTLPDLQLVAGNPEYPTGPWFQGHLAEIIGEVPEPARQRVATIDTECSR